MPASPLKSGAALSAFIGLPNVTLEDSDLAVAALDRTAAGMDFADALHLGAARDCEAFITFDRAFAKVAGRLGEARVREP